MNKYLRLGFSNPSGGEHAPAVYCKDLFADQISLEQSGETDSNFFTDNFVLRNDFLDREGFTGSPMWICPNMSTPVQELDMIVYACSKAELYDNIG